MACHWLEIGGVIEIVSGAWSHGRGRGELIAMGCFVDGVHDPSVLGEFSKDF